MPGKQTKSTKEFVSATHTFQVEVLRAFFADPSTGYGIVSCQIWNGEKKGPKLTACGDLSFLKPGQRVVLQGHITTHPKYGEQLKVSKIELPETLNQGVLKTFLESDYITGIGPAKIKAIMENFNVEDVPEILDKDPRQLLRVPGIGESVLAKLTESWKEFRGNYRYFGELLQMGISPAFISRILPDDCNNPEAVIQTIKDNPYVLMRIRGMGFAKVDGIGRRAGIEKDDPRRISAAIREVFAQSESAGHCYLSRLEAVKKTLDLLGSTMSSALDTRPVENEIKELIEYGHVIEEEDRLYDVKIFRSEQKVAEMLLDLAADGGEFNLDQAEAKWGARIDAWERANNKSIHEDQRTALLRALEMPVSVLTGGPGTGKTTILKAITDISAEVYRPYRPEKDNEKSGEEWIREARDGRKALMMAAPTGKAAQRMSEATGREASTIHRLLDFQPDAASGEKFSRTEKNPLPSGYLIVDESSMLDISLTADLCKGLGPDSRLLLVGDADQLPPIGAGNVLSDLIESQVVPVSRLTKVWRQSDDSSLVEVARCIREKKVEEMNLEPSRDFLFMSLNREEVDPVTSVKQAVHNLLQRGFSPEEILLLTPQRATALGTVNLNRELQDMLNPNGAVLNVTAGLTNQFRVGDRVIQTENDYTRNVWNGDIGVVVGENGGKLCIHFEKHAAQKLETYKRSEISGTLGLAYALTVHKAQGSESPAVVFVAAREHSFMLSRNLIYTGITRGKQFCCVVGDKQAFYRGIMSEKGQTRQTTLMQRLQKGGAKDDFQPQAPRLGSF